jgi:hypothetical protein
MKSGGKKHKRSASFEMKVGSSPELLLCSHIHLDLCFKNPKRIRRKYKESVPSEYHTKIKFLADNPCLLLFL